jgi:hypothetical protein
MLCCEVGLNLFVSVFIHRLICKWQVQRWLCRKSKRKLLNDRVVDLSKDEELNRIRSPIFHVRRVYSSCFCCFQSIAKEAQPKDCSQSKESFLTWLEGRQLHESILIQHTSCEIITGWKYTSATYYGSWKKWCRRESWWKWTHVPSKLIKQLSFFFLHTRQHSFCCSVKKWSVKPGAWLASPSWRLHHYSLRQVISHLVTKVRWCCLWCCTRLWKQRGRLCSTLFTKMRYTQTSFMSLPRNDKCVPITYF